MERDWNDYVSLKGGITGARAAFEYDCKALLKEMYPDKNVDTIRANPGDDGIDIYVGNLGQEPIKIYQCKFFLSDIAKSQKSQINSSFTTAITATNFEISSWYLLIPYHELNIKQALWFHKWQQEQYVKYNRRDFIELITGNTLIQLMKKYNLYNNVFKIQDSLNIIETNELVKVIHKKLIPDQDNKPYVSAEEFDKTEVSNIFNIQYTESYEKFYVDRDIDLDIINSLFFHKNLWIYGTSGVGKTTTITRILKKEKIVFHYIYLTSIVSATSAYSIFESIIIDVAERYLEDTINLTRINNQIKHLVSILNQAIMTDEIIIYIDEISVANEEVFSSFVNDIIALSLEYSHSNNGKKKVRFVLSTIQNPTQFCNNKPKAIEYFHFTEVEDWSENELTILLNKISNSLSLKISNRDLGLIIKASKGSPRTLKEIFYKKVTYPQMTFEQLISRL